MTDTKFRDLLDKIDLLGWKDTLAFISATLVSYLSFGTVRLVKYYFVKQPVPARPRMALGATGSIRYYIANAEDAVLAQAPRPIEVIRNRFGQHAHCVVAARDDQLAGFIWLCPQTYSEDEVRCLYRWTPEDKAEWDFDVFISPPFRMSRLFVRLWDQAHAHLRSEGIAWTISRIDAFNAASRTAHRKLGAETLAQGWFLIADRLQLSLFSVPPFWHISTRAENRPVVCFDLSSRAGQIAQPDTASS